MIHPTGPPTFYVHLTRVVQGLERMSTPAEFDHLGIPTICCALKQGNHLMFHALEMDKRNEAPVQKDCAVMFHSYEINFVKLGNKEGVEEK